MELEISILSDQINTPQTPAPRNAFYLSNAPLAGADYQLVFSPENATSWSYPRSYSAHKAIGQLMKWNMGKMNAHSMDHTEEQLHREQRVWSEDRTVWRPPQRSAADRATDQLLLCLYKDSTVQRLLRISLRRVTEVMGRNHQNMSTSEDPSIRSPHRGSAKARATGTPCYLKQLRD